MPTIKQIAQKAGVSPTTVSNVIHGKTDKVSPHLREKIEIILGEENYAPNMAANILAHNDSRIVSVIMFSETRRDETQLEDPFSYTILGNIEAELRKHGYYLMVHTTSDEDEILRLAKSWKLAGVILLWVPQSVIPALNLNVDCPIVHIDSYDLNENPDYLRVGLEDKRGGYEIGRYFISMGHHKLVFLSDSQELKGSDYLRFSGCRDALSEAGIPLADDAYLPLSKDREERNEIYRDLMTEPLLYSGMIFSSDYYAAEAITYYRGIGVDVPRDISITGFDDNVFSRMTMPGITTIHQDAGQKGQIAVELLMKTINGESVPQSYINLPVKLIIRDSVRFLTPEHQNPSMEKG